MSRIPIIRGDDDQLLGYVAADSAGWMAMTVFAYPFGRSETQAGAEKIVREQGLAIMSGVWQYLDPDDRGWHSCVLREAYEGRVTVARTNAMGYQDPDDVKIVTLVNPTDENLIKA